MATEEPGVPPQKPGERLEDLEKSCVEPGLYIFMPDGTRLELTLANIERVAAEFWEDPTKFSPEAKKAIELEKCEMCPDRGRPGVCHAIHPILPIVQQADKYRSYTPVRVLFKAEDGNLVRSAEVPIQQALSYVCMLSLICYCDVGKKYWEYYEGIHPLMQAHEIAHRLLLNINQANEGDPEKVRAIVEQFEREIMVTTRCVLNRLHLLCREDALLNAFVTAQSPAALIKIMTGG